jgi:hypothetical protein
MPSQVTVQRVARQFMLAVGGLAATLAAAEQPDAAAMQRMMEQMQVVQACLAKADQNALAELRTKGETMAAEMKAMCAAGKRDAAQAQTLEYAREMADSPVVKSLAECGDIVKSMLALPFASAAAAPGENSPHVCDLEF